MGANLVGQKKTRVIIIAGWFLCFQTITTGSANLEEASLDIVVNNGTTWPLKVIVGVDDVDIAASNFVRAHGLENGAGCTADVQCVAAALARALKEKVDEATAPNSKDTLNGFPDRSRSTKQIQGSEHNLDALELAVLSCDAEAGPDAESFRLCINKARKATRQAKLYDRKMGRKLLQRELTSQDSNDDMKSPKTCTSVGVVVSGHLRSFPFQPELRKRWNANILDALGGGVGCRDSHVGLFMHLSLRPEENTAAALAVVAELNPTEVTYAKHDEPRVGSPAAMSSFSLKSRALWVRVHSQYAKLERAFQLLLRYEKDTKTRYSWVLRARLDIEPWSRLPAAHWFPADRVYIAQPLDASSGWPIADFSWFAPRGLVEPLFKPLDPASVDAKCLEWTSLDEYSVAEVLVLSRLSAQKTPWQFYPLQTPSFGFAFAVAHSIGIVPGQSSAPLILAAQKAAKQDSPISLEESSLLNLASTNLQALSTDRIRAVFEDHGLRSITLNYDQRSHRAWGWTPSLRQKTFLDSDGLLAHLRNGLAHLTHDLIHANAVGKAHSLHPASHAAFIALFNASSLTLRAVCTAQSVIEKSHLNAVNSLHRKVLTFCESSKLSDACVLDHIFRGQDFPRNESNDEEPCQHSKKVSDSYRTTIVDKGVAALRVGVGSLSIAEELENQGFVVVKEVASHQEIIASGDLLRLWLESSATAECRIRSALTTPTDQVSDEPLLWADTAAALASSELGFIHTCGFTHSHFMWHLRMLPGVRQSFAAAFGVADSELLVSFDGASLVLAGRESALSPSGPHVDQVAHLQGLEREGIQGMLLLTDDGFGLNGSGFAVSPGSHALFESLSRVNGAEKHDLLVPINTGLSKPLMPLQARAGDLVLWDTRTTHQLLVPAAPPQKQDPAAAGTATFSTSLSRVAAYISMAPRELASQETIGNRQAAYARGLGTRHWAHLTCPLLGTSGPPFDLTALSGSDQNTLRQLRGF